MLAWLRRFGVRLGVLVPAKAHRVKAVRAKRRWTAGLMLPWIGARRHGRGLADAGYDRIWGQIRAGQIWVDLRARRWRLGLVLGLLLVLTAVGAVSLWGGGTGVAQAVTAFNVALGLEPKPEETFVECLKGATEGAVSTAIPVAEIVVAGELALGSPLLVVFGAGLGCGVGTINGLATAGVGWTVHTGAEIWHTLLEP